MTLGFITPEYPHKSIKSSAGIGTSMGNLVPGLIAHGVSVVLFVYGQDADEKIVEAGLTLYRIKSRKYKFGSWFFSRKHLERFVTKKVLEHKIDALEAPDWTGPTAFCRFPVPLTIRLHGSDTLFCTIENRRQKLKN
ncbi:MAG: glycosyltransferase family 1 protein, partial [Sphingobacteriales bacterium]